MRRLCLTIVLTLASAASGSAGFTFSNDPGPHPVGLRVKQQYDYSRVYKTRIDLMTAQALSGERARPIQSLIWYPAAVKGKPVTYRDYFATVPTQTDFSLDADAVRRIVDTRTAAIAARAPDAAAAQEAGRPMRAARDAADKQGKFPVVIYAPSYSADAMENADLCEYLASQGYIVIASASMGARSRQMTSNLEGLEAQAGDIAFLIAQAHGIAQADTSRIGVIGFSWGGLANVLAAAKDDRIGALVSLDGSLRGYAEYIDGGKDAAKYVTPARLAVPLLYVGKRPLTVEALQQQEIQTTFSLMNRMKYSDVYIATMHPMNHMDFSSQALRYSPDSAFDEYTREEAALAHSMTARYVHRFLDAYLKKDAAALAYMNNAPAKNGMPAHMMSLDIRRGARAAPTQESLVSTLATRGFAHAIESYEAVRKDNPSFALDAGWINQWGYALVRAGRAADGIEIFKLGTHVYPADGNLYDSLAEIYEHTGDKALAVKSYQRSLELWPKNANAVKRLKALGAEAP